jgi:hypothetical protein
VPTTRASTPRSGAPTSASAPRLTTPVCRRQAAAVPRTDPAPTAAAARRPGGAARRGGVPWRHLRDALLPGGASVRPHRLRRRGRVLPASLRADLRQRQLPAPRRVLPREPVSRRRVPPAGPVLPRGADALCRGLRRPPDRLEQLRRLRHCVQPSAVCGRAVHHVPGRQVTCGIGDGGCCGNDWDCVGCDQPPFVNCTCQCNKPALETCAPR